MRVTRKITCKCARADECSCVCRGGYLNAKTAMVYLGLYDVVDMLSERPNGFKVYRFKLERQDGQPPIDPDLVHSAPRCVQSPCVTRSHLYSPLLPTRTTSFEDQEAIYTMKILV